MGQPFRISFALSVPGSHSLGTADAGYGQRHRRGYQRRGGSRGDFDPDGRRHERRPHGHHPRGGHPHLCEPQFRPAQTDRVPGRLRDAELRRAGAVRSHHGCEGHVEGRRHVRGRRGVGRGAAGGDLDQRDQHDHRHEADRRSSPGRPQHRATFAVDRRLQRHLERVAVVCAEQLGGRHRRQHQPLALSDLRQRRIHRGHAAFGEHRGNGGQFRSDRHEPGLRQFQHVDHVHHPPWHQQLQWPAV